MKTRIAIAGAALAAASLLTIAGPAEAAPKDITATVNVLVDADGAGTVFVPVPETVTVPLSPGQAKNLTGAKNAKTFAQTVGAQNIAVTPTVYAAASEEFKALVEAELEVEYDFPPATYVVVA